MPNPMRRPALPIQDAVPGPDVRDKECAMRRIKRFSVMCRAGLSLLLLGALFPGATFARGGAMLAQAHFGGPPIGTQGVSNVPFDSEVQQKPGWPDYNYGSNYDPSTKPSAQDCKNWPDFPPCAKLRSRNSPK